MSRFRCIAPQTAMADRFALDIAPRRHSINCAVIPPVPSLTPHRPRSCCQCVAPQHLLAQDLIIIELLTIRINSNRCYRFVTSRSEQRELLQRELGMNTLTLLSRHRNVGVLVIEWQLLQVWLLRRRPKAVCRAGRARRRLPTAGFPFRRSQACACASTHTR